MVAWYWLLVCGSVAAIFGYFLCALMVISKESDDRIENIFKDEHQRRRKETGRWSHDEPWLTPDEKPDLPRR